MKKKKASTIMDLLRGDTVDHLEKKLTKINEQNEAPDSNGAVQTESEAVPVIDLHRLMLTQSKGDPATNCHMATSSSWGYKNQSQPQANCKSLGQPLLPATVSSKRDTTCKVGRSMTLTISTLTGKRSVSQPKSLTMFCCLLRNAFGHITTVSRISQIPVLKYHIAT